MSLPLSRRILFPLLALAALFLTAPVSAQITNNAEPALTVPAVQSAASLTNSPAATNQPVAVPTAAATIDSSVPGNNVGAALLRVTGMLALVLALFLGGVWLFRNWQRLTLPRGQAPKLNILETRSLGGRHAIFVVGYEQERFLIASSPAGINMLTHLHSAEETATDTSQEPPTPPPPSFGETLAQMLRGGKRP